ncbi:hypothetical protein SXCC_02962 [Gluconacetobacter sp. SXCC-1]|nr:hypothetical protein SXCC_02962 [Gluconacetobacter sp. SXCC-1]
MSRVWYEGDCRLSACTVYLYTPDSFFDLFTRLRAEKLIP